MPMLGPILRCPSTSPPAFGAPIPSPRPARRAPRGAGRDAGPATAPPAPAAPAGARTRRRASDRARRVGTPVLRSDADRRGRAWRSWVWSGHDEPASLGGMTDTLFSGVGENLGGRWHPGGPELRGEAKSLSDGGQGYAAEPGRRGRAGSGRRGGRGARRASAAPVRGGRRAGRRQRRRCRATGPHRRSAGRGRCSSSRASRS